MATSVAFIGTGIMGTAMAGHLLEAGHPLFVHNRTKNKTRALTDRGAKFLDCPASCAAEAEVVCICVTDTPDVERIILGPQGILEAAKPGQLVIDHSTISPGATKKMAAMLKARGAELLDAPVSGGDLGARNATLSIMVGGSERGFERALPILRLMGRTITHCGKSGCGQMTKLVNQVLVSVTCLAVSEALTFAKKGGLDLDKTIEALAGGAAGSWQLENLGPKMVAGDLKPGFTVDLQQKDLKLVLEAAEEAKTSLPAASLAHQLYTAAQAARHGKDGTQALFTVLEKLASLH